VTTWLRRAGAVVAVMGLLAVAAAVYLALALRAARRALAGAERSRQHEERRADDYADVIRREREDRARTDEARREVEDTRREEHGALDRAAGWTTAELARWWAEVRR
jgi:hypothetical protein